MEEFLIFAVSVILISTSGVMSPGPLFTANIAYGLKEGTKSGIKIAYGHAAVELPLIIFLGLGLFTLETFPQFRIIISILGALALFSFAGLQIKNTLKQKNNQIFQPKHSAFLTGILFSALNPFFIIWWLTIGFKLISDSIELWSFSGIFILFGMHIWMDFVWLTLVSFFASKSTKILSNRNYKVLMIVLGIVLIYFGITYIVEIV